MIAKSTNLQAFLDAIAWAEGTSTLLGSDDGYDVLVGNTLFHGYDHHPNIRVWLPRLKLWSTAAGRYQLLYRYWVAYSASLHLPDFGHASQDAIAIQQIRERKALVDIEAGNIASAVGKCSNIWASLPGAGNTYGQGQRSIASVLNEYQMAGGRVAT